MPPHPAENLHFQAPSYLLPRALGSLSILRLSVCVMEMTVAATYQWSPVKEHGAMRMPSQNNMTLVWRYTLGTTILRGHLKWLSVG